MNCVRCGKVLHILSRYEPVPGYVYTVYFCTACNTRWEIIERRSK